MALAAKVEQRFRGNLGSVAANEIPSARPERAALSRGWGGVGLSVE